MIYKYEYMTMKQLGELFGVTSHVIGKWLKELDLRHTKPGDPTTKAREMNLVQTRYGEGGYFMNSWHTQRTVAVLEGAGHRRVLNPPTSLAIPTEMKGPFEIQFLGNECFRFVGSDGEPVLEVVGTENAKTIKRLINEPQATAV